MRIEKLKEETGATRLVLCFAGWAASPELFRRIGTDKETDVWIVFDYRQRAFNEPIGMYKEIYLVAWSLGVWVAGRMMKATLEATSPHIRWTTVAVNGTGRPISDSDGIPEAIFRGTLERLDAEGLRRFVRRMCGSRERFDAWQALPARPLEEVREELQTLYDAIRAEGDAEAFAWDRVWLSRADRIFPYANLSHYWQEHPDIRVTDTPHEPFYQWDQWEMLWR